MRLALILSSVVLLFSIVLGVQLAQLTDGNNRIVLLSELIGIGLIAFGQIIVSAWVPVATQVTIDGALASSEQLIEKYKDTLKQETEDAILAVFRGGKK